MASTVAIVSSTDSVVCESQIPYDDPGHVLGALDELDVLRCLAGGALHLFMALVPDQQDVVVVVREPLRLVVHLRDQRTGRVDRLEVASGRLLVHQRRDAMGGEHDRPALGHFVELLDEDRATRLQVGDHVLVVHDLLAHVDR
jgi:hypothetical protein